MGYNTLQYDACKYIFLSHLICIVINPDYGFNENLTDLYFNYNYIAMYYCYVMIWQLPFNVKI